MKKLNKKQEFEKMQKMYDNCIGLKDKMDFATFTFKYYDDMIKKYEELREYWGSTEWHKFMEEAEKETAEKPAEDSTEETPEDEIARLKAKIAELEAAKPQPAVQAAAQPIEKKKKVIVVRKKPAVSE
jgi:hypothetical protein